MNWRDLNELENDLCNFHVKYRSIIKDNPNFKMSGQLLHNFYYNFRLDVFWFNQERLKNEYMNLNLNH